MDKKVISKFSFRSVTASSEPAKTSCWVYNTGVIVTKVMCLSNNPNRKDEFCEAYHRFGKTLYVRQIGFKYKSLNFIQTIASKAFAEAGINPDELL